MKKENIFSLIFIVIYFCAFVAFSGCILKISILSDALVYISLASIFLTFSILVVKNKIRFTINKYLWIVFFTIGLLGHICLTLFNYNVPQSDYATFYYNAVNFSEGIELNSNYIAVFPYLFAYISFLGSIFKLFGSSYVIVIVTNIVFDFLIAFVIYKIVSLKSDKNIAKVLATLWLANPINTIWCAMAAPIVIVNFMLVLVYYLFELVLKSLSELNFDNGMPRIIECKNLIVFSILSGFILGVGNFFRPIMIIVIIAIFIYFVYVNFISLNKKRIIISCISFLLIVLPYFGVASMNNLIVEKVLEKEVASTSGWTLYLGSQISSNGMWNEASGNEINEQFAVEPFDPERIQKYFKDKALANYKEQGLSNIELFIRKYAILTQNIGEYTSDTFIYNVNREFGPNSTSSIKIINNVFMFVLVFGNVVALIFILKYKKFKEYLFYMLINCGFLCSHLFVEVSPRYTLPCLVSMFIVFSVNLCINNYNESKKI